MKINEIDDQTGGNPIDQVAQGAAQKQGRAQTGFGAGDGGGCGGEMGGGLWLRYG